MAEVDLLVNHRLQLNQLGRELGVVAELGGVVAVLAGVVAVMPMFELLWDSVAFSTVCVYTFVLSAPLYLLLFYK